MRAGRVQRGYRTEGAGHTSGRLHYAYIGRSLFFRSLFFVTVLSIIVILGTYSGTGRVRAHDSRPEGSGSRKYYRSIEVQSGDTLWDIAELYMDDSYHSVTEYMNELIEINQLGSGRIHEGRYLTVVYQL